MLKPLLILAAIVAGSTLASLAAAKEDPAAREAAAKRYMATTPIDEMIVSATTEMAKQLPPEQRALFKQVMLEEVNTDLLEQITLQAMTETFTTDELNAFADFYGSAVGKSAIAKFGQYMGKINPPLQAELMRALQATQPQAHDHSQTEGDAHPEHGP